MIAYRKGTPMSPDLLTCELCSDDEWNVVHIEDFCARGPAAAYIRASAEFIAAKVDAEMMRDA